MTKAKNLYLKLFVYFTLTLVMILNIQLAQSAEKDLVLLDLNGKQVKVSDFKGKWVIVNYWATWCPPCAVEIPELNAFHIKHEQTDAVVVGVNIEIGELESVKDFAKDFKITYPILQALDSASSPYGQIRALPTTFVLDRDGNLFKTIIGAVTMERLENIIKSKPAKILKVL